DRRDGDRDGCVPKHVSEADGAVGRAAVEPSAQRRAGAHPSQGIREMGFGICKARTPRIPNPQSQIPAMNVGAWNAVVPMACVTAAALAAMVAEAFRAPGERMPIGPLGAIGLAGALISSILLWSNGASSFGVVLADKFGLFVTFILIIAGFLSLAISEPTIDREQLPRGEYYALMLFAVAGMMLMATATDLLVIFLALEVLSLAVYVLTGIRRDHAPSTEGALKYFVLGAFSSAFFLYGI